MLFLVALQMLRGDAQAIAAVLAVIWIVLRYAGAVERLLGPSALP